MRKNKKMKVYKNRPKRKAIKCLNTKLSILLIPLVLGCFALLPKAHALTPAPDGGYPGGNTAEGQAALLSLTSGGFNTAVGFLSLRSTTEGKFSTAVGAGALLANTADQNTATGAGALLSNTTGFGNTANGAFALFSNTEGSGNTAVGISALVSNTTGIDNTANGTFALLNNTEGSSNTAVGRDALLSNTAHNNTAIGRSALGNNTAGTQNTASGVGALENNTTGSYNTATGLGALFFNTTADNNTAVGINTLLDNTTGGSNTANGANALFSNTTGFGNTASGVSALINNTTGNLNTALGFQACTSVTTVDNVICIGANIDGENLRDSCYIGNIFGQTAASGMPVLVTSNNKLGTTTSSKRFKDAIKPMDKASETLFSLKPVTFRYKKEIDPEGTLQFGLVAEEVEKVNHHLVVHDKEGKPYSVRYDQVNAMLLNEFLKEHDKVAKLEATVARQEGEFQSKLVQQEKQIAALASGVQKMSAQIELNKFATRIRSGRPVAELAGISH